MKNDNNGDKAAETGKKGSTRKKATAEVTEKLASAEEAVEVVAKKARKTARKVAEVVTETVKELAGKVSKKTDAAGTGEKKTRTRITKSTEEKAAAAADKPATTRRRTKTAALTPDVTSADVTDLMAEASSSEDVKAEAELPVEAATDVRQHFFHDQMEQVGPPPAQAPRHLPEEYGDTKLVLLVRDPEWVYAYWEISDDTRQQVSLPRNGHSKRLVLRMFKITGRNWPEQAAHYFFDVDVDAQARSWYVKLPEANESWCAELGVLDELQNFVPVVRSNVFLTPRNSISDHVDSEWMTVEESFEKITRLAGGEIRSRLQGTSGSASELLLRTVQKQISGILQGERAALSSGLFSSESALPVAGDKNFWLQVNTELILYGATEPTAKVTVQGRPVELNPDGTFSLRFALPDGEQVLEVRAVNADGDMEETVTPVVTRETR